jgi:hypothetical protein
MKGTEGGRKEEREGGRKKEREGGNKEREGGRKDRQGRNISSSYYRPRTISLIKIK